ncbi:MAG: hypothetical protein FJW30_03055 [Acidobacteria bacterium]|nr:hypothetical protein [Acidobacteriota bacterium]
MKLLAVMMLYLPMHAQMVSQRVAADFALAAKTSKSHWKRATPVRIATDRFGKPLTSGQTEVRSVWTSTHLYFLFRAPFERQHLRPAASRKEETWGLWDYDVVEVFIGHDLDNIQRYKEFEVSPQNEWVDLDVDRARKGKEVDWLWNSNFKFLSRVDTRRKVWLCEMAIPWTAIEARPVRAGNELRLNLYRIEGPPPDRKYMTWRPVNSPSFHTPEAFGRIRLAE